MEWRNAHWRKYSNVRKDFVSSQLIKKEFIRLRSLGGNYRMMWVGGYMGGHGWRREGHDSSSKWVCTYSYMAGAEKVRLWSKRKVGQTKPKNLSCRPHRAFEEPWAGKWHKGSCGGTELGKDEGLGADNDRVDGIGQCQSQRSFWVYHLGWVRDLDGLHDTTLYPI